ncbi:MAG TPA: hypothetical protein VN038_04360 [Dyadobacter sp.]|nr:hypothetical protein [Dyadobacter sp.]
MRTYLMYWLVSIFCFSFFACKHETPDKPELRNDDVAGQNSGIFVSGSVVRNGKRNACFWKNDTVQILDGSFAGAALCIFVTDKDILVGGESDGKPCYWHNGKKIMINLPGAGAVTGILLNNNIIYAIGYVHEGSVRTRGFLLKGTNVSYLNAYSGYANDFVFDESDLYIAGADNGRPCYWKNGLPVTLSERGDVVAIGAASEWVMVAGDNRSGVLIGNGIWKNGKFELLDQASRSVRKLKIHDGKVYLLGNEIIASNKDDVVSNAFIDKDGQLGVLKGENGNSSTIANDIFISSSSAYVLGTVTDYETKSQSRICYWIDGKIHFITSEQQALGSAIFVR